MHRLRAAAVVAGLLLAATGCRDAGPPRAGADQTPATTTAAAGPAAGPAAGAGKADTGGYGPSVVLGRIDVAAVDESSGLVASRRNPGLLWTHNDSGDDPLVYCLDLRAHGCGVWSVTGADAFDWEDIAAGPGPQAGTPYLYLGDIGDNLDQRKTIVVYRVAEPVAAGGGAASTKAAPTPTARADALRLRYPDGARNAEALLVHPVTGDIYVVSKETEGATVYKAAAPVDPSVVTTLTRVTTLHFGPDEVVTGGDVSPDGRRVALCTYSRGYELQLPAGTDVGFDAIWSQPAAPVGLGLRLQGEAIAYRLDGRALLTTSEFAASPLQQLERR